MQEALVGLLLFGVVVALARRWAGERQFPGAAGRSQHAERIKRGFAGCFGAVDAGDAGVRAIDVVEPATPCRLRCGGDPEWLAGNADWRAAQRLAGRGVSVIGTDRYVPPHPWGSTHGDTRVTRLAIGEGREYVPLVRRSHELWHEIEQASGTQVLTQPGTVVLAHPASPFLNETRASAREYEIDHLDLTNAEVRARFPMFAVDEQTEAYYEPAGGYVRPEAAVAAQLELARRSGAQLQLGERVERWTASPDGVIVTTDAGSYGAEQLLLCVGAWISELFPDGRDIFAVYRQLLYWFPIRRRFEQLRDMPTFIWDFGGDQRSFVHLDGFYGSRRSARWGEGGVGGVRAHDRAGWPPAPGDPGGDRSDVSALHLAVSAVARRQAAEDGLLPVHEHAREPVRDRPSPRTRLGPDRVGVLGALVQALTCDRRGGRAVADRMSARRRPRRVQLRAGAGPVSR